MERFVRSVHPSILKNVVRNKNKSEKINKLKEFGGYMTTLMHLKQRGFEFFLRNYTDIKTLSDDHKTWLVFDILSLIFLNFVL